MDIGAWCQKNVGPTETIWMNAGAQRRIAYFLTGRRIETREVIARNWFDWASPEGANEKYAKPIRNFRRQIPAGDRFIIVFVDRPVPNMVWPGWHLPLKADDPKPQWWKLFMRNGDGQWVEVEVPAADHSYVSRVPGAGDVGGVLV